MNTSKTSNRFEQAVSKAQSELGHQLKDDPPSFSSMRRQTCTRCHMAVLGHDRVAYGDATKERCPSHGRN